MEEEKKKKKNKKKKNKQIKTAEDASIGIGESASADQIQVNRFDKNDEFRVSNASDIPNDTQKTNLDLDRYHSNDTEGVSIKEQMKQSQKEKDTYMKKEVGLEEKIKQLEAERESWVQNEVALKQKSKQLEAERESWFQNEAGYKARINQLVDEASTMSLKGAGLEEKVKQLEAERESWVQNEKSTKQTIASLNADNTRLQAQVTELEESWKYLLQENQQLKGNISALESHRRSLEKITASAHLSTESSMRASENENVNSEMLAAQALVEKLLCEKAELVEKVNELYQELDRKGKTAELLASVRADPMVGTTESACGAHSVALVSEPIGGIGERLATAVDAASTTIGHDPMAEIAARSAGAAVADPMFESSEKMSALGEKTKVMENFGNHSEKDVVNYVGREGAAIIPNSEAVVSEEIVQIPLEENEVGVTMLGSKVSQNDEMTDVSISDAPLIGAPFRFISFVARYVSGADLVNNSANLGR